MAVLKQSTAYTRLFKMIDSADHLSKKTGLTCTVNLSKAGAAFGAAAGAVSELANGWYKVALTTADTGTLGDLAYYITAAGADDTDFCDQVTGNILGDTLPVDVQMIKGQTITCSAGVTVGAFVGNATTALGVDASGRVDVGKTLGTAVTLDSNNVLNVSAKYLAGTALTGRDIGASVLLSAGTGAGQLDFTSGVVKSNSVQWLSGTIPAVNVTGVPLVDCKYLLGTIFATPATAGIPDVNAKNINNVSTASVTTINANVGTTQPTNYTGTGASALVKGDAIDWNSVAVTGMPMPTYTQPTGFLAATFPSGTIANTMNITGGTITTTTNLTNLPAIPANWLTAAGINAAALNGKGDWLTDKAGFSLAATGLDLVLIDGKTLPVSLQYIAASTAGKVSGAGSGTEVFKGLDSATTRLTITVDSAGNRTAIVYG